MEEGDYVSDIDMSILFILYSRTKWRPQIRYLFVELGIGRSLHLSSLLKLIPKWYNAWKGNAIQQILVLIQDLYGCENTVLWKGKKSSKFELPNGSFFEDWFNALLLEIFYSCERFQAQVIQTCVVLCTLLGHGSSQSDITELVMTKKSIEDLSVKSPAMVLIEIGMRTPEKLLQHSNWILEVIQHFETFFTESQRLTLFRQFARVAGLLFVEAFKSGHSLEASLGIFVQKQLFHPNFISKAAGLICASEIILWSFQKLQGKPKLVTCIFEWTLHISKQLFAFKTPANYTESYLASFLFDFISQNASVFPKVIILFLELIIFRN
jgi:hypothetical protein